ncbi:MAG: hypothetical protein A2650_04775 [Candidatus Yanofskybacteria bacterium RIFCSPHIGHO2_01_FULL_41_53]|uniref:Uncharacterized protein n=1 Tax=Candidatus Yanofskybacteria bacterium RIFCSPHIGHO2_01_FULL_41_53 TaxID=1802663 RepID=A0A1F8ELZ1_9BACT|nr:MAG: hypothetical protein A2650_04775 [Candidatus Yanofskybacteria bacterium RIFCSPHIGHO2_01_FULL_41_53]OGN24851.1 MAG: hypothetical protein A2916_04520 [Candidatus Yanofskybacteria bacterium RIFCSPLOWO2_01_FULL_41_67]OGN28992.1 MAG: hypothetical protein A3H54_03265 [Candidatus Yanofskybacteria bacterium RIFCSPLOWO2_02_FULL_41_13]
MKTSRYFWLRNVSWDDYSNNNEMHRERHEACLNSLNNQLELKVKEMEKEYGRCLSLQEIRKDRTQTFPINPAEGFPHAYYSYKGCILFLGLFQK